MDFEPGLETQLDRQVVIEVLGTMWRAMEMWGPREIGWSKILVGKEPVAGFRLRWGCLQEGGECESEAEE